MCSFKITSLTDLLFLILCGKGSIIDKINEDRHLMDILMDISFQVFSFC